MANIKIVLRYYLYSFEQQRRGLACSCHTGCYLAITFLEFKGMKVLLKQSDEISDVILV